MKKNFKYIFLLIFLAPCCLLSTTIHKPQLLEPKQILEVLNTLKDNAIVFGTGDNEIHTFIDPYCELSQRYLSFIFSKKDRMFSKYTFYFYLYELKGKNSFNMITTILSSEYKDTALKTVMIDHLEIVPDDNGDAQDDIDEIEYAAKKIGVFKRPYILINGRVK